VLHDLRHALRMMLKTPAFSAAVIGTMTLAIGANAAIFSVAHAVLLRRLPFQHPDQLMCVWSRQTIREKAPLNIPDFLDYRDGNDVFERLSALTTWNATLSGAGDPERVQGLRVSANLFETLGVDAALGRTLRPDDDRPGATRAAVLTHGLWVRRFGSDPDVVGTLLALDGESFTIVGVLQPSFFFPIRDAEFAAPLVLDADPRRAIRASVAFLRAIGRVRPGTSPVRAYDAMNAIAARLHRDHPETNARKIGVTLVPIADEIVGGFRTALVALAVAVAGVLVVACANLASLTLARGSARATELATRLALGATRLRLARQLLTESLLLAALGGVGGAGAAAAGIHVLLAIAPPDLPRMQEIAVDRTVLLFTLGTTVVAGVAFGLIPALVVSKADVHTALKDGTRGASDGRDRRCVRRGLVTAEVAVAVVLSIGAGLFARSVANLQAVRLGFDAAGALSARISLIPSRHPTPESLAMYQRRTLASVLSLPSIESAGAVSILPLGGQIARVNFTVAGRPIARERVPTAQYRMITPGYLRVMRIPVLRGRGLTDQDSRATRPVVLVNDTLARQFLDGTEPIGAHLLIDDNNTGFRPVEIVGVVGDVRQVSLDGDPTLDLYLPYEQLHEDVLGLATANMYWVMRGHTASALRPEDVRQAREAREAMTRADPTVPIAVLRPLDQVVAAAVAPRRFNLLVIEVFAAAALLLSAAGIYAVLSYSVSERGREFAIRSALGARPRHLVLLVVGQGLMPALAGVAVGLAAAFAIGRTVASLLFGVSANDPATFAGVSVALLVIAVAACLGPALRASRSGIAGARRT
jgi:predicted permease